MSPRKSKFNPRLWTGAIADHTKSPALIASAGIPDAPLLCWFRQCLPTYNQNGPSCVGHAWANWLELMLRRYSETEPFQPGEQISGEHIWLRGRDMFYTNRKGGLTIRQGFEAMRNLGYIPPEATLLAVLPNWICVGYALQSTPLVQAHNVHPGWDQPDPASGCIDHSYTPTVADGYHATLRIGRLVQNGKRFYVGQNSWGPNWGWHGLFVMTESEDAEGIMTDGPYTANLPSGWTAWEDWRKGKIKC